MSWTKISKEQKLEAVKACLEGKTNPFEAGKKLGVGRTTVYYWVQRYEQEGEACFDPKKKDHEYPPELKLKVVKEFLNKGKSCSYLVKKYNIRGQATVKYWVNEYNRYGYFHQGSGGINVTNAKAISFEERLEIVHDCIEDPKKCGDLARKHQISYQMIRYWVTKYKKFGPEGLEDRRGQRTVKQVPRDEIEELKIQVAKLEHQNYLLKVERDLLKKAKELERGNR